MLEISFSFADPKISFRHFLQSFKSSSQYYLITQSIESFKLLSHVFRHSTYKKNTSRQPHTISSVEFITAFCLAKKKIHQPNRAKVQCSNKQSECVYMEAARKEEEKLFEQQISAASCMFTITKKKVIAERRRKRTKLK